MRICLSALCTTAQPALIPLYARVGVSGGGGVAGVKTTAKSDHVLFEFLYFARRLRPVHNIRPSASVSGLRLRMGVCVFMC